jgi:glyoxylase-like metal-dependent hydrolase (beta-lactamase superfamily II)
MLINRRLFLCSGSAALLGSGLAQAKIRSRDITVTDVNGLAVFAGAGCNVVGLRGPEGALLIDGGLAVNSSVLLKAVHGNLKTKHIQALFNTHWHPEQVGCNEAVGNAGGTIISHEVTRLFLGRRNIRSALYADAIEPLPEKARPTKTTYNTGSLAFAGEQVDYRYLPGAHTNGDLFVHFPKHNVIVAGGPVSAVRWPVMDYLNGAFMHGFVRSYEILAEAVRPDTVIVPADGPTLTGADIVRHKDMYWALFKQFFTFFNKGFGPQDVIAAQPLKDHEAQFGDPAQFLEAAYRSVQLATVPH